MSARLLRWPLVGSLLFAFACGGGINCGGCSPGTLAPVPGGFPADAKVEGLFQARLSRTGLGFFESQFSTLASKFLNMHCGAPENAPCPANYMTLCDPRGICVNSTTGKSEPVVGFEIERTEESGVTLCRDDPNDPSRRRCYAWLRFEGLTLGPQAPNVVNATLAAKIYSTPIPLRGPLGMDCVVTINSASSGSPLQDLDVSVELRAWTRGQRQLDVVVTDLAATIADGDVSIIPDPVHGDFDDQISCRVLNLPQIKVPLMSVVAGSLKDIIDQQISELVGWRCGAADNAPCPTNSACNVKGFCEENGTGEIVPQILGEEGRLDLAALVPSARGAMDVAFVVGGNSVADTRGVTAGVVGGVEVVPPIASCAMSLQSPRLRAGWTGPRAFPTDERADLDFDGTAETPFMVGAGVSKQALDHVAWASYSAGVFCSTVTSYTTPLVNTGSLAVLMPSLRQLTHTDKFDWATAPASITIRPSEEPRLLIGSGRTSSTPPSLAEPLVRIEMDDLSVDFSGLVEERWVHLMSMTADVKLDLGLYVTPANTFELLVGDTAQAVTNIRITNHEILGESAMELADAVPTLLAIVLPQITQALDIPLTIPPPEELGGFEIDVRGIRGIQNGAGVYDILAAYFDLGFDPSRAPPNLSLAAETVASIRNVRVPSSSEMAVTHLGGPERPQVEVAFLGIAPPGRRLESQFKIDGGSWSPFVATDSLVLSRPEWLVQGRHRIEVRSRVVGDYRSLDPTPVLLDFVIDTEPPLLSARLDQERGGAVVRAADVVSGDRVRIELGVDGVWRAADPNGEAFVSIPELGDLKRSIAVRAIDEAGLNAEQQLGTGSVPAAEPRPSSDVAPTGCSHFGAPSEGGVVAFAMLALGLLARRRRFSPQPSG